MNKTIKGMLVRILSLFSLNSSVKATAENPTAIDELYFAPKSLSLQRAAKALPMTGSEDVSYLLVRPTIIESLDCLQYDDSADKTEFHKLANWLNPMRVVIKLDAPKGKSFDGKQVWDVMMSLGLCWGDMDLFHWDNDSEYGGDSLFSVYTTTQPGYFIPEDIADGSFSPESLVFWFEIVRSPDPSSVFESMISAAQYAKNRLGGELSVNNEQGFNTDIIGQLIAEAVSNMKSVGVFPGQGLSMRLWDYGNNAD